MKALINALRERRTGKLPQQGCVLKGQIKEKSKKKTKKKTEESMEDKWMPKQ
jgi:hypothetical protein